MAKKQINDDIWSQIKGKYVAGQEPIYKIAQHYEINKKTIERRAKKENWIFGSVANNVARAIENATIETLIKVDTDKAVRLTNQFLKDSKNIRAITMVLMDSMAEELQGEHGAITASEATRLLTCQKVSEVASKTIEKLYTATRRALGMDKDEDIRKAKEIQSNDKVQEVVDPLAGKTIREIEHEIAKLDD